MKKNKILTFLILAFLVPFTAVLVTPAASSPDNIVWQMNRAQDYEGIVMQGAAGTARDYFATTGDLYYVEGEQIHHADTQPSEGARIILVPGGEVYAWTVDQPGCLGLSGIQLMHVDGTHLADLELGTFPYGFGGALQPDGQGGYMIDGIDPQGEVRLEGLWLQNQVEVEVEVWSSHNAGVEQYADVLVEEYAIPDGHTEKSAVGGVTLRFEGQVRVHTIVGGAPFAQTNVLSAIAYGYPWAELSESAYPGQNASMAQYQWGVGLTFDDMRAIPYAPPVAQEYLSTAGHPDGFELWVLFPEDNSELQALAESLGLFDLLQIEPMPVPEEVAPIIVEELLNTGHNVLWLHP